MSLTPGLKITNATIVRKRRLLPLKGQVLFNKGTMVSSDTIVARTYTPGDFQFVNVSYVMSMEPRDILQFMLKSEGDEVEEGEVFAEHKMFFGLIKTRCKSPTKGRITNVSTTTGRVIIQEPPVPVSIKAYIPGEVVQVIPEEGVIIQTPAAFAQGIFGVGGETHGKIVVSSESPEEVLTEENILPQYAGKVVVGGSCATEKALKKASEIGAAGVVVGGIEDKDLISYLGYDIGVAITGQENVNTTVIITEGFGRMRMSDKMFNLLKTYEGEEACICGATQIRAGVIRPEIIIPRKDIDQTKILEDVEVVMKGLKIGTHIRIIREPYFGDLGVVIRLPEELQQINTLSKVRILEAELEDGRRVVVPRANVEILEM